jgi:hypothetical protein
VQHVSHKHCLAVFLVFFVLLGGCKSRYEEYQEATKEFELAYGTTNVVNAEKALLKYKSFLEDWQERGISTVDYNFTLGLASAQLFHLYQLQGKTELATQFFNQCTNHLAILSARRKVAPQSTSQEAVVKLVVYADSFLDVKWKKQLMK